MTTFALLSSSMVNEVQPSSLIGQRCCPLIDGDVILCNKEEELADAELTHKEVVIRKIAQERKITNVVLSPHILRWKTSNRSRSAHEKA
jgi:hypothetical protein